MTVTSTEDDQIRVNVVPKKLKDDENKALTTPLTVTGAAEELDAELGQTLVDFVGSQSSAEERACPGMRSLVSLPLCSGPGILASSAGAKLFVLRPEAPVGKNHQMCARAQIIRKNDSMTNVLILAAGPPESRAGEPLALTPAQALLRKMVLDSGPVALHPAQLR